MTTATATRDHVLNHQPWTYCYPVSDGQQRLLHIGCRCGRDTHVGEIVEWTPAHATQAAIPCAWCHRPLEVAERRRGQKYHKVCAKDATKKLNRENQAAKWAAKRVAVEA